MAIPTIKSFSDLYYLAESFRLGSTDYKDFLHTTFAWFDEDDHGYFGQIQKPKLQATLDDIAGALELVSDEEVFPPLQQAMAPLSTAPDNFNSPPANELKEFHIKRPPIHQYDWYKEEDCLYIIPASFLEEATALVHIARHQQHPNIIKFHGCRVRRGRITGLILDKYEDNLRDWLRKGQLVNNAVFMDQLESAVRHLHSLGLAHNDINPANIMIDEQSGMPVLVDFGSCHKIGDDLTASRGTPGWIEVGDDYTKSKKSHDICALDKIRLWLNNPVRK